MRMRELFDARLNADDKPMSHTELVAAAKVADVIVPTVTDHIDRSVLSQSGEKLNTLDKNPNSWQAHNHLGAALYMRGDVKDAAPHFLRATQLKPENPESHNNLGLAYSIFGDMPDAINQYETAVNIKDDSAMETNLANAYEQVKRFDDAIRTYKHALDLNDGNASAHCNLGYALMQQGRVDEAIPQFMKTIELDPAMPQGRADLIQALKIKGINPDAPEVTGSYPFDANQALNLIRISTPQQPQGPPPQ